MINQTRSGIFYKAFLGAFLLSNFLQILVKTKSPPVGQTFQ